MVHQQRYNTGNIQFSNPFWDKFALERLRYRSWKRRHHRYWTPVYGHYRTEDYEGMMLDGVSRDFPEGQYVSAKPSSWYREEYDVTWGMYSDEVEEDGKLVIDTVIKFFLLNHRQRLSLSRYRERIDDFLDVASVAHMKARSTYPLFLPLGNAIRDIQNFWKEQIGSPYKRVKESRIDPARP